MRLLLTTISTAINLSSYYICNFIYNDDIDNWYNLRAVLISLSFMILYQSFLYESNRLNRSINIIYSGLFFEDITDRLFYDIDTYETNDIVAVFITILIAIYNYRNDRD